MFSSWVKLTWHPSHDIAGTQEKGMQNRKCSRHKPGPDARDKDSQDNAGALETVKPRTQDPRN